MRNESAKRIWWLHERARGALREALLGLPRFIATPRVAKHRFFVFLGATVLPDTRLNVIARADDLSLGILSSRMHEAWSLANASIHGDGEEGGRPTFNAKSCFETFPFPGYPDLQSDIKPHIAHIAHIAQPLNDLRENWLNPTEWTERIPEVIPLGMSASPYPDRIVAKPGFEKELAERTLTKLYNQRPAGLDAAHKTLDTAVAAAYGWADYTADMPDEEILKRLLALNLERARTQ